MFVMSLLPPFDTAMMWSRVTVDFLPGGRGIASHARPQSGQVGCFASSSSHSSVVKDPPAASIRARRRWANTFTLQSLQAEKYVPFERRVNRLVASVLRHK